MEFGIPIPTIDNAVSMRPISALKADRITAAKKLNINLPIEVSSELREAAVELIEKGLHIAFVSTYAQGMSLLKAASSEKNYGLDLADIAKIWRGGCIIRAALLEDIRAAFTVDPSLDNLLIADNFIDAIREGQAALKAAVHFAISSDVPCMSMATALNYLKSYTSERLPANLIQAQRDFFGAHTYQRTDKDGTFHTPDWDK
jgi:6-phosphogluconate dehydrogenase